MKTNPIYSEWLLLGLMVIPFVYLATVYGQLPAEVPSHYGVSGQPDRYMAKESFLLVFGGLTAGMYLLFRLIPKIDPKRNLNTTNYLKIRLLISVFWCCLLLGMWYTATQSVTGETFMNYMLAGVFLLIAGLGNLLYSVRPNYFVGIRTPWTLDNEVVWRKTHQRVAPFWVAGGLLGAAVVFWLPVDWKPFLVMGIALSLALGSVLVSFLIYQREKAKYTV